MYNLGIVDRSEPLPKKLGRAAVGLLLGITTTRTDPVLVHTLPNGLGIYRTPFIDQDGSQLAYGGPHQIFSTLALQLHMGLPGDKGSCFYPTPLEQETIPDQQMLDYHNPVGKNHLFTVMQSCYKANIPIARLRELIDEDNVSDILSTDERNVPNVKTASAPISSAP